MAFTFILLSSFIGCAIASLDRCPPNLPRNQNLMQFGASCYEYHLDHTESWNYADSNCKIRGGYLVSINSASEQADVFRGLQLLNKLQDVWIGYSDGDGDQEGKWQWASGEPTTYTNWATDQPGMVYGWEDCAIMDHGDSGYWHDYTCDSTLGGLVKSRYGWVCEFPIGSNKL